MVQSRVRTTLSSGTPDCFHAVRSIDRFSDTQPPPLGSTRYILLRIVNTGRDCSPFDVSNNFRPPRSRLSVVLDWATILPMLRCSLLSTHCVFSASRALRDSEMNRGIFSSLTCIAPSEKKKNSVYAVFP